MLALIPMVLSLTGYVPNGVQNTNTLNAMRFMIGGIPAVLLSLSIFFAWKFPITREKFAVLRKQIDVKNAVD